MKKPLVIVENDLELQEIKKDLDKGREMLNEQLTFLEKQHQESFNSLVGVHWERIEEVLKERNLLPEDYSDEKYSLSFSNGVLYILDKDEKKNPLETVMSMLFDLDR